MNEMQMSLLALGIIILALGLAGNSDFEEVKSEDKQYCAMVDIYKSSRGESGWPDFRGTYEEGCK